MVQRISRYYSNNMKWEFNCYFSSALFPRSTTLLHLVQHSGAFDEKSLQIYITWPSPRSFVHLPRKRHAIQRSCTRFVEATLLAAYRQGAATQLHPAIAVEVVCRWQSEIHY